MDARPLKVLTIVVVEAGIVPANVVPLCAALRAVRRFTLSSPAISPFAPGAPTLRLS